MLFWNEIMKLYSRKQFVLLLAVFFFIQLAVLSLYERNTEEYTYLFENRELYLKSRENPETADLNEFYKNMLYEEAVYQEEYRVFIDEMEARTEQLKMSSILLGEDPFRITDLDKTLKDYENFKMTRIIPGDYTAAKKYGSYLTGVLFELGVVLLLLYYGFSEDKEKGNYPLLRSSVHGRAALAASKIGALAASLFLYMIIQETSDILLLSYFYGFGNLSVPVQSIPLFRNTCIHLNVVGMYGLSFLYKGLGLLGILTFGWMLLTFFSRIQGGVIGWSAVLALSFLLWKTIPVTHSLKVFRYLNIFSLYLPSDSIGAYVNLNFFGLPLEKHYAVIMLFCVTAAGAAAFGILFFSLKNQVRKDGKLSGITDHFRKVFHITQESRSLWFLELYKPLFQQKKLILMILILIYGVSLLQNARKPLLFVNSEESFYDYYAQKLTGEYGERQRFILAEEDNRNQEERAEAEALKNEAAELREEAEKLGGNERNKENRTKKDLLSLAYQKEVEADFISNGVMYYEDALSRAENQCLMLEERAASTGKTVYFLNTHAYRRYFTRITSRLNTFLLLLIVQILMTTGLYAMDERFGMKPLIQSTKNGGKKIRQIRAVIMLLFAFILFLIFLIPEMIRLYGIDQFECLKASLGDFLTGTTSDGLSILTVLLLTAGIKFGVLILFGAFSFKLSQKLKNETTTVVLLTGAAILITVFGYIFRTDLVNIFLRAGGLSLNEVF